MDTQSDAIAIEQGECALSLVDGRSLMNSGGHPLGTESHLWSTMACSGFNQHTVPRNAVLSISYEGKQCGRCLAKHTIANCALRKQSAPLPTVPYTVPYQALPCSADTKARSRLKEHDHNTQNTGFIVSPSLRM